MFDLEEQLRSYGDQLEEMVPRAELRPRHGKASRPSMHQWQAVVGIAASLLVIAGLFIWVLQRSNENTQPLEVISEIPSVIESTPSPQENLSVTPNPDDTADRALPATVGSTDDGWDAATAWSEGLSGDVRTSRFEPAFSFVAPLRARRHCTETANVVDVVPGSQPLYASPAAKLHIVRYDDVSMRETFDRLSASAGSFSTPLPATVGGAPALTFDATAPEASTVPLWTDPSRDGCSLDWRDAEQWRFWVVDVDARTVVVALSAPSNVFRQVGRELGSVVPTMAWRDFDEGSAARIGAVMLPKHGAAMRPGEYFSEQLGTSILIPTSDWFEVQRNEPGHLVVTETGSTNPGERSISLYRVTELIDPTNVDLSLRSMDPSRIDDWLAAPPPALRVGAVETQRVSGYSARVFDVVFRNPSRCISNGEACWGFAKNDSVLWMSNLSADMLHRVYWIDQGVEDPIVILVSAPSDADDWFDDAQALIDTIELSAVDANLHQRDS